MAGDEPKVSAPGAFPETPAPNDDQTFSVNPIPASGGMSNPMQLTPGEPVPSSSGDVTSGVHDDPELKSKDEQSFGVAPIPASGGIGNPIQLAPGEKVPDSSTINSNTVQSTATTDQASYERSDASPPVAQPTPGTLQDRVAPSTGVLGGPGPMIPESSMAMGDSTDINKEDTGPTMSSVAPGSTTTAMAGQVPKEPRGEPTVEKSDDGPDASTATMATVGAGATTLGLAGAVAKEERGEPTVLKDSTQDANISSVAPGSTTADMAGQQPKEERGVPEIVSESQQEAKVDPEASANPEAVAEKKDVEAELKKEVPEASSTAESGTLGKSEDGVGAKAAAGVAAAGVTVAGAAVAANEVIKDKTGTDAKAALPPSVQETVDEKAKESSIPQKAAESSTDAARETTTTVPTEVKESQEKAGESAEASGSPDVVKEKAQAEQELLSKVSESEAKGEPAPTASAAEATSAPAPTTESGAPQLADPTLGVGALSMDNKPAEGSGDGGAAVDKDKAPTPMDSRDVSPMSKPATQQEPQVTTGVASSSTPQQSNTQKRQSIIEKLKNYKPEEQSPTSSSTTPSKPATPTTGESKKKENRRSFFGRIKDKLK